MYLHPSINFGVLFCAFGVVFHRHANGSPMEVEYAVSEAGKTADLASHKLGFQPGENFRKAVTQVHSEIEESSKVGDFKPFQEYTLNVNPEDMVTDGDVRVDRIKNAEQIMKGLDDNFIHQTLNVGVMKTSDYKAAIMQANGAGHYSMVVNGEGPDHPCATIYMAAAKKAPQHILMRPNPGGPKADINTLNTALQSMEQDASHGNLVPPTALMANTDSYDLTATSMRDVLTNSNGPYSLVVFGSGEPILELIENRLGEFKDRIYVTHVGPWFWNEKDGKVVWELGFNSKKNPWVEQQIINLGIRRFVIHSGTSKLKDFSNLIDENDAHLALSARPSVNLHSSGVVNGLAKFYSDGSHSSVGRMISQNMDKAAEKIMKEEFQNIQIAEQGKEMIAKMTDRNAFAAKMVLEYAMNKVDSSAKSDVYEFWKGRSAEELEAKLSGFPQYKKPGGSISAPTERDLVNMPRLLYSKYESGNAKTLLLSLARKKSHPIVQIHANDAQVVVTAVDHIGIFGLPVSLAPDVGKDGFNLFPDHNAHTLAVTWVDQKRMLDFYSHFFTKYAPRNW